MKNWMKLLISIGVPVAVGAIAGFFTSTGSNSWYQTIEKPSWQPPGWLFGPVWTTLYILMGIALYLVWKSSAPPKIKRIAITLWIIQLVFNFLWSFIFFTQHQIDWALAEILVLWFFILLTIIYFAKISKPAAWLLVPYISWVSFASMLTYTIYKLNM
ncbi:tryptophan-rich sensory protein [Flavisolibacter sp. BT320]|nr:tryptophan-rich sensory protein [Flavisolibacter longurius]